MATIRPLKNTVMFEFLDATAGSKGEFRPVTQSGIVLVPSVSEQKKARWGRVLALGPDCVELSVGDFILVEALMWMEGTKVEGQRMWKTDDSKILAVTNDITDCQQQ